MDPARRGAMPMSVLTTISWGELIDKVTILEIKIQRIQDPAKARNVERELSALRPLRERALQAQPGLAGIERDLKAVNLVLWEVEDEIRACEQRKDFGPRFIELARSVYHENDRRALLKSQINGLLGSDLVEEKSYRPY